MKHLLLRITDGPLPVNPAVANARRLIHFAAAAAGRNPSPPVVASHASLLAGSTGPKLTAEVARDLQAKFLSHYPGELLSPELAPSLHFFAALAVGAGQQGPFVGPLASALIGG